MGWIGVDLDGTLAKYPAGFPEIGPPIPLMVQRVRDWLAAGHEVRIVTARVSTCGRQSEYWTADVAFADDQRKRIELWCLEHIGTMLPVTAEKDFEMHTLWDDRCVQVIANTGIALQDLYRDAGELLEQQRKGQGNE